MYADPFKRVARCKPWLSTGLRPFHFRYDKDAMSNATITATTVPPTDEEIQELSLFDADKLVLLAFSNLQTAARIYKKEGLTQAAMVERLATLGIKCSERTIQRVFSDLRKQNAEGFNPVGSSERTAYRRKAAARAELSNRQFGGMAADSSTSVSTTVIPPKTDEKPSHTEPSISSSIQAVQPIMDTYSDEQGERVVSMGTASDRDWQDAVAHLNALRAFTHKYFDPNGPITEQQWEYFYAECYEMAYFADMRFANLRKENEQTARSIVRAVFSDGPTTTQET